MAPEKGPGMSFKLTRANGIFPSSLRFWNTMIPLTTFERRMDFPVSPFKELCQVTRRNGTADKPLVKWLAPVGNDIVD